MCTAMDTPPCNTDTQDDILSKIDSRKSNKPLMEKKRRQRINRCLNDLKSLVLEGMKKDPSRYSKLEKADILEMTVRHVQALHRHEGAGCRLGGGGRLLGNGRPVGSDGRTKYRAGFIHCAVEVTRYLAGLSGVPHDLHHRLISHLNTVTASLTCVPGVGQLPGASVAVGGGVVTVAPPASRSDTSSVTTDTNASVPHTPAGTFAVSGPPPVLLGSAAASTLTSTSVALVPAGLAPQQKTQVLSSPALVSSAQATQPQVLALPALPTPAKTHPNPDLGSSESVSVPQTSQLPKHITLVVHETESSQHENVRSFVSSGAFPPRIPPLPSTLTSPGESVTTLHTHGDQDKTSVATQAVTPVKEGQAATSVSDPVPSSSQSQGTITTTSCYAAPLGFQVSLRLSSATTSPPAPSAPLWSSPVLVRPTPTLPTVVQHHSSPLLSPSSLSSPPSSSLLSTSSLSSSSSSLGAGAPSVPTLQQPSASLVTSPSKEPLNLAINHPQESTPRGSLKVLSAPPWSRPAPYPHPRRLSPRPSQPWRPW